MLRGWFGTSKGRPFIDHVIDRIEESWDENKLIVVEAPTGYGKSVVTATLSLYSASNGFKLLAVYPLRSLLKDQYDNLVKLIDSRYLGRRYMHEVESPFLVRPVTLTTLDTFSLTLMGIPPEELSKVYSTFKGLGTSYGSLGHFMFSWASTYLSDVVLDEIQLVADETKSLNFLYALIKLYLDVRGRLLFMSATIPDSLKEVLREASDGRVEFITFSNEMDHEFVNSRCSKRYEIRLVEGRPSVGDVISAHEEFGGRGIVVFNTIDEAVRFYRELKENFRRDEGEIVLLHSRFTSRDRDLLQNRIKRMKEGIVVTTQVIEAGMDISSNFMFTDMAPANSLVQRAGRFLRHDEAKGILTVFFDGPPKGGRYKVYDAELVERTWNFLREREGELNLHIPGGCGDKIGFSEMINYVYSNAYRVNREKVGQLLRPLLHFESGSKGAIEIFHEMEGSFVREGNMVPVVTEVNEGRDLPNKVIPLPFSKFSKLVKGSEDVRAVVKRNGYEVVTLKRGQVRDPKALILTTIKFRVVAFLVRGTYSTEEGLITHDI